MVIWEDFLGFSESEGCKVLVAVLVLRRKAARFNWEEAIPMM